MGILRGVFFERGDAANTKKPDMGLAKKSHAAKATNQVVEPEAGRRVE